MIETVQKSIVPSRKIERIGEYYFSKKLDQIRMKEKEGARIINLGIGSPDMPAPLSAVNVLIDSLGRDDAHMYQPYRGIEPLRQSMVAWYKKYFGVDLDSGSEILPLMGSKEGIMHISMAFLNKGDAVLVPDPGYPTYEAAANLCGARCIRYDLLEENDWLPNLDLIVKGDLDGVKLMWVNYPNMPTGKVATHEELTALVEFSRTHNILIVNDNPYSFILNDNPVSILSVPGAFDTALELNSMSKSHNMAGWRIGMLAGESEFINWTLRVKSNMDSGMFLPLQLAACEALRCGEEWFRDLNEEYRKRREIVYRILDNLDCRYDRRRAGLFVWAAIGKKWSSSVELSDYLLDELGIFITPGTVFGSNGFRYVRISLCVNEDVLNEALTRIQKK